jgi:hypothetical protein
MNLHPKTAERFNIIEDWYNEYQSFKELYPQIAGELSFAQYLNYRQIDFELELVFEKLKAITNQLEVQQKELS